MTTKPFSEGKNQIDRVSTTFVSNSMDTTQVDAYRQGVELTLDRYFQQGIAKIWSGNENHAIEMRILGEEDDDIFPEVTCFVEVSKFDPVLSLRSDLSTQVVVIDTPISTNERCFDGVIEPLSIRRAITFSSIDVPFEAHSVNGSVEGGNLDAFRRADKIVSRFKIKDISIGNLPFEDNVDMFSGMPTNLGYWPATTKTIGSFDDAQKKDGIILPENASEDFKEKIKELSPATENYGPPGYDVSAAVFYDYNDWIYN